MAEIISISETAPPPEPLSLLDLFIGLWWLWLLILIVIGIIVFFIARWILKIKEDEDEIIKLYKERRKLCKQHRNKRYYKAYFRKSKNAPISCIWEDNKKKWHKKKIGWYYGDYYSKEGSLIIAFSRCGSSKWFVFPDIGLIIINKKAERNIKYLDKNKQEQELTQSLPVDIEQFMEDEILLKCVSIDKLDRDGMWFAPVLSGKDGKMINPTVYLFEQFKDVFLGDYLLTNMNDALQQSKKALDMNQWIRGKQKLEDNSQSVENPPT